MKVALCAIAKQENLYIREWVEWYKRLGVDTIFLYDNNDPDGERFEDVIEDYIRCGFVRIIDYRGRKICQLDAYNDCYKRNSPRYDWIAFFDIDEFLRIDNPRYRKNIKNFLDSWLFDDFDVVMVCWMCMTDNGLLKPDGDYSVKKFTQASQRDCLHNRYAKSICRTSKHLRWKSSVHVPDNMRYQICDVLGRQIPPRNHFDKPLWRDAVLLHYRFKTLEEFITKKLQRLYPDHDDEWSKNMLTLDYFFEVNERTPEKEAYAEELLKQYA